MERYIKKSALVAEIERRLRELSQLEKASYEIGLYDAYKIVLSFIDTLEVKEVDLEISIQKSFIYHELHGDDFRGDRQIETAFRTGFKDGFKCKGYIIQ